MCEVSTSHLLLLLQGKGELFRGCYIYLSWGIQSIYYNTGCRQGTIRNSVENAKHCVMCKKTLRCSRSLFKNREHTDTEVRPVCTQVSSDLGRPSSSHFKRVHPISKAMSQTHMALHLECGSSLGSTVPLRLTASGTLGLERPHIPGNGKPQLVTIHYARCNQGLMHTT